MGIGGHFDDVRALLADAAESVFGSLWTFLVAFGALLLVLGAFYLVPGRGTQLGDIMAGLFGIWGATAAAVGLVGYGVRRVARP